MDHSQTLLYSDFFAQLQSAQDLLAEQLGICLVLVNREGQEVTLPSCLPMTCNKHVAPRQLCPDCHVHLIHQLAATGDWAMTVCPNGLQLAALSTSIRTDDGDLYLLAGRIEDRAHVEKQEELLRAIFTLPNLSHVAGERPVPTAAARTDAGALTQQESRVLRCMVAGLSNKEIASHLCISPSTVKTHVASILKKLNLSNRTEASVYALKNGIQPGEKP